MSIQQGALLGKQRATTREWLRFGPRCALSTPFKTIGKTESLMIRNSEMIDCSVLSPCGRLVAG